jgi:hypothetical protein
MRDDVPGVLRGVSKFVLEIAPAALAAVIGVYLVVHYRAAPSSDPRPVVQQLDPVAVEDSKKIIGEGHALAIEAQRKVVAESQPKPVAPERREPVAAKENHPSPRRVANANPPVNPPASHAVALPPARPARSPSSEPEVALPPLPIPPPAEKVEKSEGILTATWSKASELTEQAIAISKVREAVGFVRGMADWIPLPGRKTTEPSEPGPSAPQGRALQLSQQQ